MIRKVEGIIIRSTDYGEGNKILTLYTREFGKVGVMAKGAKKTKSRLSAVSQLFTHGYFVFYHGGGLGSLTQGDVIESFREIRSDIMKTAWAAYLVELIDKLTEEKERNPYIFELLITALQMIQDDKDAEIITRIVEIHLMQSVGIRPELRWCMICSRDQIPLIAFSIREGGLLCADCLHRDEHAKVLSPAAIRLLRTFSVMDLRKLGNVDVKAETRSELAMILQSFMDQYIGVQLKSRNFLNQLSKLMENPREIRSSEGENDHGPDPSNFD